MGPCVNYRAEIMPCLDAAGGLRFLESHSIVLVRYLNQANAEKVPEVVPKGAKSSPESVAGPQDHCLQTPGFRFEKREGVNKESRLFEAKDMPKGCQKWSHKVPNVVPIALPDPGSTVYRRNLQNATNLQNNKKTKSLLFIAMPCLLKWDPL